MTTRSPTSASTAGASSSPAAPRGSARRSRAAPPRLGAAGIVVCGRNRERGEARARAELGRGLLRARRARRTRTTAAAIVRACDAHFGRLDGLVNAAGLTTRGTLDDTSVELWDRLFAVNVRAPFLLTQEAARLMRRGRRRQRREHHHDGQPRRRAGADRLLELQGRAGDAHPERGLPAAARPHPRQRPEHRLDGDRGRARRADRHRAASRLARRRPTRSRPARPAAAARRHRPDGHLPAQRRGARW